MIIKLDIVDLEVDVSAIFNNEERKNWFLENSNIDTAKSFEELTSLEKKRLISLLIYEEYFLSIETLCNLPSKHFSIKDNDK